MKKLLLLTFLFSATIGFTQNLVPYKVSEDVSINIPKDFQVKKKPHNTITIAIIDDNNDVMVSKGNKKTANVPVENVEDLLTFYDNLQTGFLRGLKGKLINREIIEMDKKMFLKLNCAAVVRGKKQYFDSYLLLLNDYTYAIMFVHKLPNDTNLIIPKAKILASLKFKPGLTIHNQFNKEESNFSFKLGKLIGAFLVYGAFVAGLVYLIIRNRKRKRNAFYNNN